MDMKQVSEGDSADLNNAIQANDEIANEINGNPLPAKSLNNLTSGSLDRNQCQDIYPSSCPYWTWACTDSRYNSWMQNNCQKSCGWCTDSGQCQDSSQYESSCPGWKWACTVDIYVSFMQSNCQKSCGWCPGGCPEADGYVNMMNKCFYIENNPLNYAEAKANCQNKEGRLFEPRDLSTNDQVIGAALVISPSTRQTSDFWIGMNDISTEGTFQYTSTGGDLVFTDWSYNEPNDSQGNEDCGITWFGPDWNDAPCVETYHSICEIGTADCFVENRLFVGDVTLAQSTLAECKQKCEDTECCKFWTWNTMSKGCGIRCYEVTTTVKAPTQMTGRKGTGEELNDQVYVSKSFKTTGNNESASRNICRNSCLADPKCLHFTLFGPNFEAEDKDTCVLEYGPPDYRKEAIPLGAGKTATGFASAPKFCP